MGPGAAAKKQPRDPEARAARMNCTELDALWHEASRLAVRDDVGVAVGASALALLALLLLGAGERLARPLAVARLSRAALMLVPPVLCGALPHGCAGGRVDGHAALQEPLHLSDVAALQLDEHLALELLRHPQKCSRQHSQLSLEGSVVRAEGPRRLLARWTASEQPDF